MLSCVQALIHQVHLILEDLAVHVVVCAAVRVRGARAQVLADDVRPAVLVTPREAGEEAPLGQVVDDRRLLGDAERVLGAHHVAQLPHADVLRDRRPVGVQDAWVRPHLVALGVEMVLDGGEAPDAEVVGRLDDVVPAVEGVLIPRPVAADGPQRRALLRAFGGQNGERLEDNLDHGRTLSLAGTARIGPYGSGAAPPPGSGMPRARRPLPEADRGSTRPARPRRRPTHRRGDAVCRRRPVCWRLTSRNRATS